MWARFVAEASEYSPWERVRSQVILGEEELVDELRGRVAEARATGGIPSSQLRLGAESLESAADRLSELLMPRRSGGAATRDRALAAVVLKDVCLATYGQIGLLTGLTQWGARSLVDRGRRLVLKNLADRNRYAELSASRAGSGRAEHKTQP